MADNLKHAPSDNHFDQEWMKQLMPSEITTWWARVGRHATDAHKDATLADIIEERT